MCECACACVCVRECVCVSECVCLCVCVSMHHMLRLLCASFAPLCVRKCSAVIYLLHDNRLTGTERYERIDIQAFVAAQASLPSVQMSFFLFLCCCMHPVYLG